MHPSAAAQDLPARVARGRHAARGAGSDRRRRVRVPDLLRAHHAGGAAAGPDPRGARVVRRQTKTALGRLMFATRLDALLLRRTGVVVAFHRVHDGGDEGGLSISRDLFERHCRFFKRHFDVVPLADLVTRLEQGRPVDRLLAITFDDGYRDNFVNARPVLEALSLPATFFVVSQWIGTDDVALVGPPAGRASSMDDVGPGPHLERARFRHRRAHPHSRRSRAGRRHRRPRRDPWAGASRSSASFAGGSICSPTRTAAPGT